TLAQGFGLLKDALSGLTTPAPHETVRQRMLALAGKEDPLLDLPRFDRFLRQAHDAEVAEVRKVGDGAFDIAPFGSVGGPPARLERPPQQPSRVVEPAPVAEPPAAPGPVPVAQVQALRFRRGSKVGMRPAEVPLVGVVAVEVEEAPAAKGRKRGGRGAKPAATQPAEPGTEAADAVPASAPRRRRGGRSKKAAS
ncbi:MAG TPA: hypothetical protein VFU45_03600, partial [Gemmatimonadales bacterium]|nr:hypothetical protein [Gemmatimonadales bacterium]